MGVSREKLYTSPPLPPPFRPEDLFQGEGGGVYFEAPRGRILYTPPLLYARRVFSGVVGGVGVYLAGWFLGWSPSRKKTSFAWRLL